MSWRPPQEVLAQTFKGDVRESLDDFEVRVRRCERTRGEVLSDRVKITSVQRGIEDEDLRRHLLMHATRLSTCTLVREEIRTIIMARDTMSGPAPMDVSAVCTSKGKGKGKETGKKGRCKGGWKDMEALVNPRCRSGMLLLPSQRSQEARLSDHGERQTQEGTTRERCRTGTRSGSRCQLDRSSQRQHDSA